MFEEEINDNVNELIRQCIVDRIIIPAPHGMACISFQHLENLIRMLFEAKHRERLLMTAKDEDAMADLQILLWQIKQKTQEK